MDEVALIRNTISHYSPVMIAPLSINSSHADYRPERSFFLETGFWPRSGLGLVSPARAIRLLRSLCAFLRLMPADQTPRCCAYGAMMTCIVAGDASDDGAFETTFGRGGRRGQRS